MRSTGRTPRTWFDTLSSGSAAALRTGTAYAGTFTDRPNTTLSRSNGSADHRIRYTEVDGWLAAWRREPGTIRILQVRVSSGAPVELSTFGACIPDLAEMRERFPEHARLWDAIRHEFWAKPMPEGRTG